MGTSTLRFAIIVALVVGGVLVIDRAFPEGEAGTLPRPSQSDEVPESPTPPATQTEQSDGGQTEAPATKVVVGVYNGTFEDGLAGTVADQLSKRGDYRVPNSAVGNTPFRPQGETTIYVRDQEAEAAADVLIADFFADKGLSDVAIRDMPGDLDVPGGVDLVIYLGTDYQNR